MPKVKREALIRLAAILAECDRHGIETDEVKRSRERRLHHAKTHIIFARLGPLSVDYLADFFCACNGYNYDPELLLYSLDMIFELEDARRKLVQKS